MAKIQLSQRMYSVRDVNRLLTSGEMEIQPKYQRRRTAWPINAKTALMDTILNNFPIPPIYLRDYVNDDGRRQKEIIDGQQRIATIREYFNEEYRLGKNLGDKTLAGLSYSDLPSQEQLLIEDYELPFVSIRGATDSDIISIFSRLNSYSTPLNAQEKRNSKFAGEVKTLIYQLASDYNVFWVQTKVLTASQIARMADALLVSEIICTMLNNGFNSTQAAVLNSMYARFDDTFDQRDTVFRQFNEVMSVVYRLFNSSHIANTFRAKYMFFTLFMAIYDRFFGLSPSSNRLSKGLNVSKSLTRLESFCVKYNTAEFDPDFMSRFKQSTNNVQTRKYRHKEIAKLLE